MLDFETGTISFNTSTATWSHSSGAAGKGEIESLTWTDQQGNDIEYKKAVFKYDRINIGSSVTVNLSGTNPISLQTENNGNITINSNLIANGAGGFAGRGLGGVGILGGANGGNSNRDPGDAGDGIGGGGQTGTGHATHFRQWIGAGGSYGGAGTGYARDGRSVDPGPVYGDRKISSPRWVLVVQVLTMTLKVQVVPVVALSKSKQMELVM